MPTAKASVTPADLQTATDALPDGPNVAPSLHEHQAAQGQPGDDAPVAQPLQQSAAEPAQDQDEARQARIRAAAYALAAQRGFAPGGEMDDWLQAERDADGRAAAP